MLFNVIRCLRYAKSSYSNCTVAFAAINTAFDNFVSAKDNMTRSASSILPFPFALTLAAFIAPVAFAAPVAFVALIIVALFALVVALAALAAALAVAITLTKR
ncbi:hypothetical protein MBM_10027 [Drepanopeziza brunnea f. sp. 'multigermtubi' MB_m1]|uniref:Uncharacterized protein n=1 Tax=Marssonina brunnea f. sp. multigermtubi (strain MB_m1) TaxID=1072389 RepID=K1W4B7_MARBU|nr:uncharacterized protein MBM_10027 [Drepanopeziza brunnea f. sp. 'multigermtubi' MB_m1]EKD11820.1 hypothetical protein MBM_10027 [Drepanopeziza brunnea f. sp. 'multigermtubi' MB_m1]